MHKQGWIILAALVMIFALPIQSCSTLNTPQTVKVIIVEASESRSIGPGESYLAVASYGVSATKDGQTLSASKSAGGSATLILDPGIWTFSAIAYNSAGTAIGSGSTTAEVGSGKTNVVNITVAAYTGAGSLAINVSWPDLDVAKPIVTASLVNAADFGTAGAHVTALDATISSDSKTASVSAASIDAGSYLATIALSDGTTLLAQAVEAILIAKGAASSGNVQFSYNPAYGRIGVDITSSANPAITVSFPGAPASIKRGETLKLDASISRSADSCQWYLNGAPIDGAKAPSLSYDTSALTTATHRFTLIVCSGSDLGSATIDIAVTD